MISLLLLCTLQTTPLPQVRMEEDSVTIFGTCWDISTGVNLKANLTALIKGKTVKVGESSPEGTFDLKIPTSTESMTFEVKGYRSISLPVHIQGKTKKTDRFKFAIRMISVDSQQVAKNFQQEIPI